MSSSLAARTPPEVWTNVARRLDKTGRSAMRRIGVMKAGAEEATRGITVDDSSNLQNALQVFGRGGLDRITLIGTTFNDDHVKNLPPELKGKVIFVGCGNVNDGVLAEWAPSRKNGQGPWPYFDALKMNGYGLMDAARLANIAVPLRGPEKKHDEPGDADYRYAIRLCSAGFSGGESVAMAYGHFDKVTAQEIEHQTLGSNIRGVSRLQRFQWWLQAPEDVPPRSRPTIDALRSNLLERPESCPEWYQAAMEAVRRNLDAANKSSPCRSCPSGRPKE
ncbi:hypothetical protein AB3X96_39810 [Paraburkholderia sp. BR13439]|uniref:hypothetical protein n=1 Tax=Paraburkholderia TaxID=1822464 RepID=UPI0034CF4DCF